VLIELPPGADVTNRRESTSLPANTQDPEPGAVAIRSFRRVSGPTPKEAAVKVTQIRLDPDPYEPYRLSQGFRIGDLLLISGQAGIDETGELVGVGDFDAQADQTFRNLARVLEAAGSSLEHVVKVTIFLTDMANFSKIVELRGKWFTPPYPADTIVEVRSLYRPEVEIEIEAIAVTA
jgi:reactive intermediate/imine deaminase